MTHGDMPGSNIKYHFWNEERIETGSSIAFCKIDHFFLESDQSADSACENNAYTVVIILSLIILHLLLPGHLQSSASLSKAVNFAGFFSVEEIERIEIF